MARDTIERADPTRQQRKDAPVNRQLADDDQAGDRLSPAPCPFCGSSKVRTASEKVDASTYWRCEACGQMWNVGRLRASSRFGYGGR